MSIEARFKLSYPGFTLDVDLSLPATGVTAVFGHSGSGKTTLLRAIAGLERVPGGRLVVDGEVWQDKDAFLPTHARPIGYVFQEASLFPHLSVRGNLDYGRRRRPASADFSSFDHIVELLGIAHLLDRKPDRLSGGERQRVAIARALLTSPRLLLMDEPLAALDHARKEEILPYLEQLHEELKIPLLYVSHAPDEVARLADYIVVMDNGRALASGPLTETLARLDLPIRLGEDAGVVLDAVVAEHDAKWHLAGVDFSGGRLWVRDKGIETGRHVRVRILARDVSLARAKVEGTSIVNAVAATVTAIGDDAHPALCLVRLDCGGQPLLARLTRRSAAALELAAGCAVWAQIKAVALVG
ncbi:molybdenum ABC transporter ATP-binding protein [Caldichromatium japonicum]|uniref:Molybdenum ABC transporter ATP-binding protein n=1 Tax=Caldichromatium japonicum TaxID=2699430 RepID=A0A6G7VFB3_9GAMM|nr:molybdenum ABC transporter ATP-binding protein [Caldichromatium japonicum]QIK38565.1 molybdenum ABC transporter ATP-binding protein [Caldichromatium japonicum]